MQVYGLYKGQNRLFDSILSKLGHISIV